MEKLLEKLNKLSLPVTIILASLILGGFFYASQVNKQRSIERQQQIKIQADEEKQQTELQAKTETGQVKPISATLQIELCKTEAKDYADKIAKADYLKAFEDAMRRGDTESAKVYLNASFKPEHPADYDSNYNSVYIKCLKN